jgi:hypothetical protein
MISMRICAQSVPSLFGTTPLSMSRTASCSVLPFLNVHCFRSNGMMCSTSHFRHFSRPASVFGSHSESYSRSGFGSSSSSLSCEANETRERFTEIYDARAHPLKYQRLILHVLRAVIVRGKGFQEREKIAWRDCIRIPILVKLYVHVRPCSVENRSSQLFRASVCFRRPNGSVSIRRTPSSILPFSSTWRHLSSPRIGLGV